METKTLQEQIDKFYKETMYRLEVKDGKPYGDCNINLYGTEITKLPDNLVVSGSLNLRCTKITELPENLVVGGSLDLEGTQITELPKNLVVGGDLDLYGTKITELPDNLVVNGYLDIRCTNITKLPDNLVVGGCLDIRRTDITKLPDNLIVGGDLDLYGTKITELPDNLVVGGDLDLYDTKIKKLPNNLVVGGGLQLYNTKITELPNDFVVGGYLDLRCTNITKLPENLVVGGSLDLYDTKITELPENLVVSYNLYIRGSKVAELPDSLVVGDRIFNISGSSIIPTLNQEARDKIRKIRNFLQWDQGDKTYIKVDDIFSVVDSHRGNVWRTHRIGKNETLYVVTDGEGHYAHGYTLKVAKTDLIYKINDRDTSLYANLSLDDELSFEESIAMYRTITGACAAGTRNFVENKLPKQHKEKYTIREIIELTDGEYGSKKLKEFFKTSKR